MKARKGWIIVHDDGVVELSFFHSKKFYNTDTGEPIKRKAWMKKYRPNAALVRATLLWKKPKK